MEKFEKKKFYQTYVDETKGVRKILSRITKI